MTDARVTQRESVSSNRESISLLSLSGSILFTDRGKVQRGNDRG